jgi:hypothetical protein
MYADSRSLFGDDGGLCSTRFREVALPLARGTAAGAFSLSAQTRDSYFPFRLMVVGGDYTKPDQTEGTSAFLASKDGFHVPLTSYFDVSTSTTPPHGYRSAVAYDAANKGWITVGPNGTDVSLDDGRNWRPLLSGADDVADSDKYWNALSLPFVVGEKGRIGILRDGVLGTHSSR